MPVLGGRSRPCAAAATKCWNGPPGAASMPPWRWRSPRFILWFPANWTLLTLHVAGIERIEPAWLGRGGDVARGMAAARHRRRACRSSCCRSFASACSPPPWPRSGSAVRDAGPGWSFAGPSISTCGRCPTSSCSAPPSAIAGSRCSIPVTIGPGGWCLIARRVLHHDDAREPGSPRGLARCIAASRTRPRTARASPAPNATWCCRRAWTGIVARAASPGSAGASPSAVSRRRRARDRRVPALHRRQLVSDERAVCNSAPSPNQTISWGVLQLVDAGFLPLAVIIFTASILIPLGKLIGMSWLLWSVHHGSDRRLVTKTRLYSASSRKSVAGRTSTCSRSRSSCRIMQISGFISVQAGHGRARLPRGDRADHVRGALFDPRLLWDQRRGDAHEPDDGHTARAAADPAADAASRVAPDPPSAKEREEPLAGLDLGGSDRCRRDRRLSRLQAARRHAARRSRSFFPAAAGSAPGRPRSITRA